MAPEQVDPKPAEGKQELPSRPAKQPKDKAAKGGQKESLEVGGTSPSSTPFEIRGSGRAIS